MYLHLGGDTVVRMRDVIAILNAENSSPAPDLKHLLEGAQKRGALKRVTGEMKAVIVTNGDVYLSPISSTTLKKRADYLAAFGD